MAAGWCSAFCNGFQIACEAGLLPGVLMRNAQLRFICRMQHLRVERTDTAFTNAYRPEQVIEVCVAHGEGNYVCDEDTMRRLKGDGLIAFTYCDAEGRIATRPTRTGRLRRSPASIPAAATCSA